MSIPPGQPFKPATYGQSAVLYSAVEEVSAVVDGAPPNAYGHLGRNFVIPPGKAVRVPEEAARFLLDHLGYTGVVRVEEIETPGGIHYDVEGAHQASLEKLKAADEMEFRRWLSGVIEDYVKRSKPVPAPEDRIQRIIDRRHYDLKRYGIVPLGWQEAERDHQIEDLQTEIKQLKKALAARGE